MAKPSDIDVPGLDLSFCSVEEHCKALQSSGKMPFWWYQGTSRIAGNFSVPFQDRDGHWWYQVKPGLCWPVDCFTPIAGESVRPPFGKSYLGYQYVVATEDQSNSHLVINAITNLGDYGVQSINSKRRNAVRKGFAMCDLSVLKAYDADTFRGCLEAWNQLTERTGWKHVAEESAFVESWKRILDCPGASIVVGREKESGQVVGFLITKVVQPTAYVDTIASRTDMRQTNINDALMYAFVSNAARLPGLRSAHYAIRSTVEHLEQFKTGLGFVPMPFPARTHLRGPVGLILRLGFRDKYRRMVGQFDDPAE